MNDLMYLVILIIPLIAQVYVSSRYKKYVKKENFKKISGYDVARKILDNNALNSLYIVEIKGEMSDHYDPTRKTVKLSSNVFHGTSVASIAIAAHECGHAIQDKEGYLFLKIRSLIFPIVNLGTKFAYAVLMLGLILQYLGLIVLAIILVSLGLLFQLVTLPVEINASKRALVELEKLELLEDNDSDGVKSMLKAAAYTYVAGVLASALEIIRLIKIFVVDND